MTFVPFSPRIVGEVSVAVENDRVRRNAHGALIHLVDHQPVGIISRRERVDHFTVGTVDYQRIDFAGANGAQRIFGFLQSLPQFPNLVFKQIFCSLCHTSFMRHVYLRVPSRSAVSPVLDRSPTNRRSGAGSLLINVGAAMISALTGCFRVLVNVYDLELIIVGKMLFTEPLQVGDRLKRSRCRACHIQSQNVFRAVRGLAIESFFELFGGAERLCSCSVPFPLPFDFLLLVLPMNTPNVAGYRVPPTHVQCSKDRR